VNVVVRGIEAPEVDVEAAEAARVAIAKAHIEEIKGDHREDEGTCIEGFEVRGAVLVKTWSLLEEVSEDKVSLAIGATWGLFLDEKIV